MVEVALRFCRAGFATFFGHWWRRTVFASRIS
jgi:hypothetical protein